MATPQITALPDAPSRADAPTAFSTKADAFVAALPGFGDEANTVAEFCNAKAVAADSSATAAALSETNAAASAAAAQGVANFQGTWASLVGALNTPATVYHSNKFWVLLNNLADVTASEPSASNSDWTESNPLPSGVKIYMYNTFI
jgi:hypothetical protein